MSARPGKIIGLWNNFGQLATKLNLAKPAEPLYFINQVNCLTLTILPEMCFFTECTLSGTSSTDFTVHTIG